MTVWCSGLVLVGWLLLEAVLRLGDEARSWHADDRDRSSTRLIVVTYIVAGAAPLLLGASGTGSVAVNSVFAWIGVTVGVLGLLVRIWSMRVLGRDYTRSLRTRAEQTVIDRGPYRTIRHPGYLGSILVWTGSRLAVNWAIGIVTGIVLTLVYCYRINAEERMLLEHFGDDYSTYETQTWRLLPHVW